LTLISWMRSVTNCFLGSGGLGLLVSHKDLLLGPSTAVSTGILHASIPSYNGDFCVFFPTRVW
jgi:hypothetical protein